MEFELKDKLKESTVVTSLLLPVTAIITADKHSYNALWRHSTAVS